MGQATFLTISGFRDDVTRLTRKVKDGYHLCINDVAEKFRLLSYEDIRELPICIRDLPEARIVKTRLQNSHLHLSASAGFRLYFICKNKGATVILMSIYPKMGTLKQTDLGKERLKILLRMVSEEQAAGSLRIFDIQNPKI